MMGHLAVPALNKGRHFSYFIKISIETRKQLNYDGLVISDALNMHSVSKCMKRPTRMGAFNAGNDVLCFAENIPEGIQEILKTQFETHRSQLQPIDEMQEKVGLLDKEEAQTLNWILSRLLY
jgi:beta-glucosidase-like glycosyl hydrolase